MEMLLRSASSPILKLSADQPFPVGTRTRPNATRLISACKIMPRTSSEGNLKSMRIPIPEKKTCAYTETALPGVSAGGGVRGGGLGGGYHGGGGGGGGGDGCESVDKYYQEMIQRHSGDALLLANYARFLKEVKGDGIKAEEYCERAILAKENDGSLLSMYGELIWKNHKDSVRADSYFDQAVRSSPDDCYVLASYARFLWDVEDEDDDKEQGDQSLESNLPTATAVS